MATHRKDNNYYKQQFLQKDSRYGPLTAHLIYFRTSHKEHLLTGKKKNIITTKIKC